MALNYVTVTETFNDGTGSPANANVTFTPSATVYSAGVPILIAGMPVTASVVGGVLKAANGAALTLLATDNAGLTVEGMTGFWFWTVNITFSGVSQVSQSWSFFLPSSPATVELYALSNSPALGSIFAKLAGATFTGWVAPAVVALVFGASIAVDASKGNDFRVTLTSSAGTIANATNPVDGQMIEFAIAQDATGGRTVAWGTAYDFGAGVAPTLSTAAGKVDVVGFKYNAALAKWMCLGSALGF